MAYYISLNISATGDSNQLNQLCRRINKATTINDVFEDKKDSTIEIPTEFICNYTPRENMKELSFIMNVEGFISLKNTLLNKLKTLYPLLKFKWKEFDEMEFYNDPEGYRMEEGEC